MFKFNDDNIFAGYIKQLLASFNLPKYRVYTHNQQIYHDDFIKNKKQYMDAYNSILAELDELYVAVQKELDPTKKAEFRQRIRELEEQKIKAPHTPELNVLISSPRNIASTYTNRESYQNQIAIEIKDLTKLITELEELLLEDDLKPASDPTKMTPEVRAAKEQEKADAEARLIECKKQQESTEIYPTYMRYIPYIKNNNIQIYAPKVNADGTITYSDNDWKMCHYEYGKNHKAIHADNFNIFNSHSYVENLKIRNYTENLKIQNNIYDTHTHEYLGEYLRFQRDYSGLNLMPLYNCFSNRSCPELNISIKITDNYTAKFDTTDKNYKIYMVPIKLFQNYTIAIDSNAAVEMCCGLFSQYPYDDTYNNIPAATYTCFNNMQFKSPKLFTAVWNLNKFLSPTDNMELVQHEEDLKLFIKLPFDNVSSIVVLEGDYTQYSDSIWLKTIDNDYTTTAFVDNFYATNKSFLTQAEFLHQYIVVPFVETLENPDSTDRQKEVAKELLINTEDAPFPQKAILYYEKFLRNELPAEDILILPEMTNALLEKIRACANNLDAKNGLNASLITKLDTQLFPELVRLTNHTVVNFDGDYETLLNKEMLISPLQLLRTNTDTSYPFADRLIEYLVGNAITPQDQISDNIKRAKKVAAKNTNKKLINLITDGLWTPVLRLIYYNYINARYDSNDNNHDILGYVDKEVERLYSCVISDHYYVNGVRVNKEQIETISSANIYDDKWED